MIDRTHDSALKSWVDSANVPETDFPIQNLPFGTFRKRGGEPQHLGVGIGDQVFDITAAFVIPSMQTLMAMSAADRIRLRHRISGYLAQYAPGADQFLIPMSEVELLLPCPIGDYTDFYASIHHATNVGKMFRPENPLLPNYKWVPIAYHGRSSSIVVSGTPVRRPWGQIVDGSSGPPRFAPSQRLDYEVEVGAFLGPGSEIGTPIRISESEEHFFGICLLNDWSARDIQAWEYQPLGPFLGKNFATSISPWVVTREALGPFECPLAPRPTGDPEPLPYLRTSTGAYRITLEVWLRTAQRREPVRISESDFSLLYWTLGQMIAHHTSNGCPIRPGDLIGSGTVSGPERQNRGSLLERPSDEVSGFLHDGNEVILRGWCEAHGFRRIGLGECRGVILPAVTGVFDLT
jgi:fumarylacetoacetase